MPWVTKTGFKIVNGKKRPYTYRVWVNPPKKKPKNNSSSLDARDDSAALAAAKKRAASLAEARRRAARRRMWRALNERAAQIRGSIAPPTQGKTPNRGSQRDKDDRDLAAEKRIADAQKKRDEATAARYTAMASFYAAQQRKIRDRQALDKAKREVGAKASGTTLERLLREARERQKTSNGLDLDTAYITELEKAYTDHTNKVKVQYAKNVEKLRSFFKTDKKGNLVAYKSADAYKEAQKILNSKSFKTLEQELLRLYGDGKKQGSVTNEWGKYYGEIGDDQRKYIAAAEKAEYTAAYNKLQQTVRDMVRHGNQKGAAELMKQWNEGDKYLYEYSKTQIDPAKTSIKGYVPSKNGPGQMVAVYRTVEEEFEFRRDQYKAEMERQYAKWKNEQLLRGRVARMRMRRDLNSPGFQQKQRDVSTMANVLRGLNMPDGPQSRDEMNKAVDEAMKGWEAENRKWFKLDAKQGIRPSPEYQKNLQAWNRAKEAQRKRFYEVFPGGQVPGVLDTVVNLPVIKEGIAALSGTAGAIPGAGRVVVKMATGSSTIQIGINMSTLPADIRKKYSDWARAGQLTDAMGVPLTVAPNPRNPLGIFGSGNATGALPGYGSNPLEEWLKTPEGKKWYEKYKNDSEAVSQQQDEAFLKGFYGQGDIWSKLSALGEYGASPTNSDVINLTQSLLLDPTNAIPLKATTWLARLARARQVTAQAKGAAGLNRVWKAGIEFTKVTEPELRRWQAALPYTKMMEGVPLEQQAARAATIRELILTRLSGIKDGPSRAKEMEKLFRQFGINPQSSSGHQLANMVEDDIVEAFAKAGVDYKGVAAQAAEVEAKRAAQEAAERAAKSPNVSVMDAKRAEKEEIARTAATRASDALKAERAAGEAAVRARTARPRTILQRVRENPLQRPSTTVGHTDPVVTALRADDPLRQVAAEVNPIPGKGKADQQQSVATLVHAISNVDGVTVEGVQFAPGKATENFLKSDNFKELQAALKDKDPAVRKLAEDTLYEVGRRTQAARIAAEEGLQVDLKNGMIPWKKQPGGQSFTVIGGRASHQQYVATDADALARSGARTPVEEIVTAKLRTDFEAKKIRALSLRRALEEGKITREQFIQKMSDEVATWGITRRSPDLAKDIQSGLGEGVHGELDHIVEGMADDFIALGGIMFEDLYAVGDLAHYYETFSMLPGMMIGPGYETQLMADILNPAWRGSLTRGQFSRILNRAMFSGMKEIGPPQFRSAGAHLFALFHMTLLDGNMKMLEAYSKSIETLLYKDPTNVFGRMWKVMETRAGVPWADGFIDSESAFMEVVLLGNRRLHPNLALAMIPYGPLARHIPATYGFHGHLRGLATTLDPLVKASPPTWRDEAITQAYTEIASRRITTREAISKATQVAHYISNRYGSSLIRTNFTRVLSDFSIEASERALRGQFPIDELRARFIEARVKVSNIGLGEFDDGQLGLFFESDAQRRLAVANASQAGAEFDAMFNRALRQGIKRREFPMLHRLYDEMYWANEITHDVPGLHVSKFLEKMGDPAMRRGDSWVPYARSFFDHMVASGAKDEALTLIKIMFEPELNKVLGTAYEQITELGTVLKVDGSYRGQVIGFFHHAGLLENLDRVVAEGRRRVHASASYAQKQVDEALERDQFVMDDEAGRALAKDADSSLYDFADFSGATSEARTVAGDYRKTLNDLAKLRAAGPRPDGAVDAALKKFYGIRKKSGDRDALIYLHALPDDIRPWVSAELRLKAESRRMIRILNGIVRRTMDLQAIPYDIGKQMEELVATVRDMDARLVPESSSFLRGWAEEYSNFLFRSRLVDYLKHEPWFRMREAGDAVSTPAQDIFASIKAIKTRLEDADLPRDERIRLIKERKRLGAELNELQRGVKAQRTGAGGSIETKMAAGDVAGSQADNVAEGVARGGTAESGGAMLPESPRQPSPGELNDGRITMSQRALEILGAMTEEQWLAREMLKAQRARRVAARHTPAYSAALNRIENINKALKVIEVAKSGGRGSFVPPRAKRAFVSGILSVAGERAKAVYAPKLVAPYVTTAAGAAIEQGRWLYRLMKTAPVDETLSRVREPGKVSATYEKHGAAIEAEFGRAISPGFLKKFGLPENLSVDLTGTDLITNLDEFARSMKDPRFNELVTQLYARMDSRLKALTEDPSYTVQRWLDDRLVRRGDHFDALEYERVDKIVQRDIQIAREEARRRGQTDLRGRRGAYGEDPTVELFESDIRAVVGKSKALARLGIDPHAYNEARKILRTPMLRKNRTLGIVADASRIASETLYAAGHKVDDADWDALYRKAYDDAYMVVRKEKADEEALLKLDELARDEMFGSTSKEIIEEFEERYGLDQKVRGFDPKPITPFQRRTLEEAVKTHLGITDLADQSQVIEALGRHGSRPPFNNRGAMREWLTKYGYWSPRTAEAIESGKKSWSIQEEARYYEDNWGYAPDWADPRLLEKGGALHHILFDEVARGEQYRQWGLFNRNVEARFATGQLTREERARLLVEGAPELGLKPKRDLATERKYVFERYGSLVKDDAGNLIAFPELMNRDELRAYISNTSKDAIPEGIINDIEVLDKLLPIIDARVKAYVDEFMLSGKREATYADLFAMTANIVSDMLKSPVWLNRKRDALGAFIRGQAAFRRALIFTNISFGAVNVIDSQIKGAWSHFTTRAYRDGMPSQRALGLTLMDFGMKRGGALLRDVPVHGTARWKETKSPLGKLLAVTELPAQVAGKAEDATKLRLAQGMYDGVYRKFLKDVGDEGVADALAREYIQKEIGRLWPTVGDGPIERLFNQFAPFFSYQFKNQVLYLGELAGHPAFFNYFNRIGDFIEKQNRERWAEEHPNEILDETKARLIELPWAPGLFIDLGKFTDIQRGLKPLYSAADGKMTMEEIGSHFVRLVGPNDINMAFGIINAFNLSPRYEWRQTRDAEGFPTGVWERVQVPWEAPWGAPANFFNSFWPVELGNQFLKAMEAKFSVQEVTKLAFQTVFFGGLKVYDKGAGHTAFYYALAAKDPEAAKKWLDETPEGAALRAYWLDNADRTYSFYTPQAIKDILNPRPEDPNPWLHSQSPEFQAKVKQGFEDLRAIREYWDQRIWSLTPGTEEYNDAKLQAATARYQYYDSHPWMYEYEAYSMTPAEWAKKLNDWEIDDLVQSYFDMEAPKAGDYKTAILWQKAVAEWKKQRAEFLKAFPQVAERIGQARNSVEALWKDTEQGWFDILDEVGTRSIAIEAARQAKDFDLVDQLYIVNELDFNILSEDQMAYYFDPTTDFKTVPGGVGPAALKSGPFGQDLLPKLKVLPDFNKWRFERMSMQEKADFERNEKYMAGMKDIIAKAKASDNFGATFVRELKKHPDLLAEYFRRNPGKREQWAATDEYIRLISKYGILAKQGKFAEAGRYFDNLPDWVKARYYAKHPERRQKAQENMVYMNYMEKWTNFYRRRDYAGGAAFFDKLPQWVKDRYYAKNPNGFGKGGGGTSAYAKAMGKWVKLLQDGKKDEAKAYFDSLPKAYKDRYYAKHPEQKLKNDIKRVGQLGQYFAADDANRALYLKENPEFAKWLKAQGNSEQTRRMLIMAAYQGLPKDDQWLKRVFREKYPEIFSQEAKGEASLRKTYNFLEEHPEMLPSFEKWLEAVWASYADSVKHSGTRPKPVVSDHSRTRQHGTDRPTGKHRGRSAAWVRLHSI